MCQEENKTKKIRKVSTWKNGSREDAIKQKKEKYLEEKAHTVIAREIWKRETNIKRENAGSPNTILDLWPLGYCCVTPTSYVQTALSHFSHVQLFVTPWPVARQAPLSMGFSRQEYWSGLPRLPPGDLPDPGIEPRSPAWQVDSSPSEPPGKPVWSRL